MTDIGQEVLAPAKVGAMGGGLEGASRTAQETLLWNASRLSPDLLINTVKDEADFRGRDRAQNDGLGQSIVDLYRDNIVGVAYRLSATPNLSVLASIDKRFDETWVQEFQTVVEELFNTVASAEECWLDASRSLDLTGMVRMQVASFCMMGEALSTVEWIREVDRPFSTAIQMISPTRLSNNQNAWDNPQLKRGIAIDFRGKALGYWIRVSHPGEYFDPNINNWNYVPAEKPWGRKQVIHIRDTIEPGQNRGLSAMVAVLKEMRMTKKFRDVTLQNAVLNASYAATLETDLPHDIASAMLGQNTGTEPGEGFFNFATQYLAQYSEYIKKTNGIAIDGVKIPFLYPGTKLNTKVMGTPGGVGTDFEASLLRYIAAGLGVSYEELTRDFSKVNYSSARASMLTTWKHMQTRKKFVSDRFATNVYSLWLEEQMSTGLIPMPNGLSQDIFYLSLGKEAMTQCEWVGATRGQIDEMKETQAAILRIASGLSTYEEECAKLGKDWRKVFAQKAREQKAIESYKLVLSTDSTKNGSQDAQNADPNGTTNTGEPGNN